MARRAALSSVIAIFVSWDPRRERFVAELRAEGFDVRALLVREEGDAPAGVLQLRPGKIEQGLAALR
jgi:hypothetical protein